MKSVWWFFVAFLLKKLKGDSKFGPVTTGFHGWEMGQASGCLGGHAWPVF